MATSAEIRPGADILSAAKDVLPDVVRVRRRLHRRPELGLDLPASQALVVEELGRLGLEPRLGAGISSVTAIVGAARDGPTTILRADMDALPLTEATGLEFTSEIDGAMHACGHDTHVAMLLGAARLLVDRQADLPGPVLLMFQPGEEGFFGARLMLEEGLLTGIDPAAARALAIHISTLYPAGSIRLRPGPLLASADNFHVTIRGRGGHASTPHQALDPIPVAAEVVTALQTMVTRCVNVFDPAVVTVARLSAGTTFNIIPETASLEGTYRTVSDEQRAAIGLAIRRLVAGIAAAHGLAADVELDELYPVTVNDPQVIEHLAALASRVLGEDRVVMLRDPVMGAEDFSYVLQGLPGAMVFLGARPDGADPDTYPNNHSDRVVFDEASMAAGIALNAAFALEPR